MHKQQRHSYVKEERTSFWQYIVNQGKALLIPNVQTFHRKGSRKNYSSASSLPPDAAAEQHFLRVHHQVQTWLGHKKIQEIEGGKKLMESLILLRLQINLAQNICWSMYVVNVKKMGCAGNTNCSCKKVGIQCSMSCTKCNGVSCMNPTVPDAMEELWY